MPTQTRVVSPGPDGQTVRTEGGQVLRVPDGWTLLPPGDAGVTRRVKAAGPTWTVQEKVGRRTFSRGVWAPAATVERVRTDLAVERATPEYAKRREADAQRRERDQADYVQTFKRAVLDYLNFDPRFAPLADELAQAVTDHATPVGSGTVARTERIPVADRAEAAVIAWMRHRTTAYDNMQIPRVKGKRREIRRMLAARSKALLDAYRTGRGAGTSGGTSADRTPCADDGACPLRRALKRVEAAA